MGASRGKDGRRGDAKQEAVVDTPVAFIDSRLVYTPLPPQKNFRVQRD